MSISSEMISSLCIPTYYALTISKYIIFSTIMCHTRTCMSRSYLHVMYFTLVSLIIRSIAKTSITNNTNKGIFTMFGFLVSEKSVLVRKRLLTCRTRIRLVIVFCTDVVCQVLLMDILLRAFWTFVLFILEIKRLE